LKLIPFTNQISLLPHLQTWKDQPKYKSKKRKEKKKLLQQNKKNKSDPHAQNLTHKKQIVKRILSNSKLK
jgi:hypothetical protein